MCSVDKDYLITFWGQKIKRQDHTEIFWQWRTNQLFSIDDHLFLMLRHSNRLGDSIYYLGKSKSIYYLGKSKDCRKHYIVQLWICIFAGAVISYVWRWWSGWAILSKSRTSLYTHCHTIPTLTTPSRWKSALRTAYTLSLSTTNQSKLSFTCHTMRVHAWRTCSLFLPY